jgi:hypothetical protein
MPKGQKSEKGPGERTRGGGATLITSLKGTL